MHAIYVQKLKESITLQEKLLQCPMGNKNTFDIITFQHANLSLYKKYYVDTMKFIKEIPSFRLLIDYAQQHKKKKKENQQRCPLHDIFNSINTFLENHNLIETHLKQDLECSSVTFENTAHYKKTENHTQHSFTSTLSRLEPYNFQHLNYDAIKVRVTFLCELALRSIPDNHPADTAESKARDRNAPDWNFPDYSGGGESKKSTPPKTLEEQAQESALNHIAELIELSRSEYLEKDIIISTLQQLKRIEDLLNKEATLSNLLEKLEHDNKDRRSEAAPNNGLFAVRGEQSSCLEAASPRNI